MKAEPKQPKTRQEPRYWGRVVNEAGKVIADTRTGYRDEAECALLRRRMLEAGYWQIVRTSK